MKKRMKQAAALLTTVSMMAALTACGGNSGSTTGSDSNGSTGGQTAGTDAADTTEVQDVALKVWAPEEEQEYTQQVCDQFAALHPEYNMTFEYASIGTGDCIEQLTKDPEVAADVFVYPSGGIPELTEAGLLYPITAGADEVTANHVAGAVEACSRDGLLYGVPETANSWFMYYNKSMFTEDEVGSIETMMAKDLGDVYNFSCTLSDSWYMEAFFYAAGGTLFGADGTDPTECSWNDETGVKVGNYLVDLASNPKYLENTDGIAASMFKEGKSAVLCSGTWVAEELKEALGDDLGAAKLPTMELDGQTCQLSNFADYKAFGVKSNTKYPLAAQQLAVYLGSEEVQLGRYQACQVVPTVASLAENADIQADVASCALLEQANYSTPQPAIPQLAQYWTPAIALGTGIVNGDVTKDNMQASLDSMVQGFLSTITE